MNARPLLAAFFLLVPVAAACAGTDAPARNLVVPTVVVPTVPAKPTVVSTYCTSTRQKSGSILAAQGLIPEIYSYTNTTYAVWSDGSQTELRSVKLSAAPCQQ